MRKTFTLCSALVIALMMLQLPVFAQSYTVGTVDGQNSGTTYPSPLADYYEGSRQQYLYTAADLAAAGLQAGDVISALSWNVTALNGSGVVESYSIFINSTSVTSLTETGWEPAGTQVYGSVDYQPVLGENVFGFNTNFTWNGTSNILITICSGEPTNATGTWWTNHSSIQYNVVNYNSTRIYAADNAGNLCGYTGSLIDQQTAANRMQRPVITFYKPGFCFPPSAVSALNVTGTSATISWTPGGSEAGWIVEYGPMGFTQGTGTTAFTSSPSYNITGLSPSTPYSVYVRAVCGPGNGSPWAGPVNFTTPCLTIMAPYYETFENFPIGTFIGPINCWEFSANGSYRWEVRNTAQTTSGTTTGPDRDHTLYPAQGGKFLTADVSFGSTNDSAMITSPIINITGLANPELVYHIHRFGSIMGELYVDIFDGQQWNYGVRSYTSPTGTQTSMSAPWTEEIIDLSPYANSANLRVRFRTITKGCCAGDNALDDVFIRNTPTCFPPTALTASNVTGSSATLSWTSGTATGTTWNVEYGPEGFTPGTGTMVTGVMDTFLNVSGLTGSTIYEFYVQENCGTGGLSDWSGSGTFTTMCPGGMVGTFTINPALPKSATNFHTFNEVVTRLNICGVAGPVVINAAPGIYEEQVTLVPISGASPVNTITFNGAGIGSTTLRNDGTATSNWANIMFDGADHITFQNMTIDPVGASFGVGVYFTNQADSNTINNVHIQNTLISTATNFAGVIMSGSPTVNTTNGNSGNFNTISNSIIEGGYYGVRINGASTAAMVQGNQILNNDIRDQYFYGIYLIYNDSTVIDENDISRANRATVSTFNGVFLTTSNKNIRITQNRIHDTHTSATTLTGEANGIYSTSSDAPVGSENIITNNAIYNFNGSTGTYYGIRNVGSDGHYYYHNTILLDEESSASGTTYGFYQTTLATNIQFLNNIVVITRGGTGTKGAVAHATTTSTITSNYNVLHKNTPAATGGGYVGIWGTAGQATLAAWQTASGGDDMNSSVANPVFTNPEVGNLEPLNIAINNMGTPVGVLFDIENQPRSLTVPDVGAWEFTGVTADIALIGGELASGTCPTANDSAYFTIKNTIGGAINFATTPLTIVYNVTGPVNTSGTRVVNSGTLAAGATMQVGTAGINFSQPGIYTLNAHILPNSSNLAAVNDTLQEPATIEIKDLLSVSPATATVNTPFDVVTLTAQSPLFPGGAFFMTEIAHFKTTSGQPTGGWPPYLIADDYIEITGVPNSDLAGYTLEQWDASSMLSTHTFPSGTVLSPNGTAIIAVGQLGASVPSPSNYYYHGNGSYTGNFSSGGNNGRILKDPNGDIIDAVGVNGTTVYTFPAASGVTAADWSGNIGSHSSMSGVRLIGPDVNNASTWVLSSTSPQNPNQVNSGVTVPAATSLSGLTWTYQGATIDTIPEITVGPYNMSGTYNYVVTYNSICGTLTETATVTVTLPPANDVGVTDIIEPVAPCGDSLSAVVVEITNHGLSAQSNIPVVVQYSNGTSGTLTTTYNGTLQYLESANVTVGTINTSGGGNYTITAFTNMGSDMDKSNDTMSVMRIFNPAPEASSQFGSQCVDTGSAVTVMANDPNLLYFWYDEMGNQIGFGTSITVFPTADMDIYAEAVVPNADLCGGPRRFMADINLIPSPITIQQEPDPCFAEPARTLVADVPGGVWSGTGITDPVNGIFEPSIAGVGLHEITYTVTAANGCVGFDTMTIDVKSSPIATISGPHEMCLSNGLVDYDAPSPSGVWYGPGIINSVTGMFDPMVAGPGIHIITYDINVVGCVDIDTHMIEVYPIPDPTITQIGFFCSEDAPVMLQAANMGGTFSGPGVSNGMFDPNVAGVGFHTINYTITNQFGCTEDDTMIVEVRYQPHATISAPDSICWNAAPVQFNVPDAGGVWFGNGISTTGLFDPQIGGLGTRTITYSISMNGCSDFDSHVITVDSLPNPTIMAAGPYCANNAPVTLMAATPGGTWSGPGITGAATGTFNPATAGPGTHTITYSVTNIHGCTTTDTEVITVHAAPSFTVNPAGPFCTNGAVTNLTASMGGGYWSGPGVVNPYTGAFNPAVAGAGTHTISYSVTNGNNCTVSQLITVQVNAAPNAQITTAGPYCMGSAPVTLAGTPSGGTWSGPGVSGNSFNPTTAGPGTHTITYSVTNTGGCTGVATKTITVLQPVVMTGSVVNETCSGNNNGSINVSAFGGTGGFTYNWSNGATTKQMNNLSPGSYTVTVTDAAGCTAVQSFTVGAGSNISVTGAVTNAMTPQISSGAIDATVSGGTAPYTYAWSHGAATEDVTGLAPGTYTLSVRDANGCVGSATFTVEADFGIGIADIDLENGVHVYPNPATDLLNLELTLATTTDVTIEMYDMTGRKVYAAEESGSGVIVHQLDASNLPSGEYIIRFRTEDQMTHRKVSIVR